MYVLVLSAMNSSIQANGLGTWTREWQLRELRQAGR